MSEEKKKRTILETADVFNPHKLANFGGKFNEGDKSRNNKVEIGIWNGNLPLVLEEADKKHIPVLIMKGVADCGRHWEDLKSEGFTNWQLSCNIYLSYEYCSWGGGYTEGWLLNNTFQTYKRDNTFYQWCPEYGVHWKSENGEVLNIGKYTDKQNGIKTQLVLEPYSIEGVLSDYFLQFETIDMKRCVISYDNNISFKNMASNSINNVSQYKIDYSTGAIYKNIQNLISLVENDDIPLVCFYVNDKQANPIVKYFPNVNITKIDSWKNNTANLMWGCASSNEEYNSYKNSRPGGEWQTWIGNLDKNPQWKDSPLLIKIYDKVRGVNKSFSYEEMNAYVTKTNDNSSNFIEFFTSHLSDFYNGVTKKSIYNVTFQDYDGSQIGDVQEVYYGESATPPIATRTGYVFTKWEPDYNYISCDITCVAQYNKEQEQEEQKNQEDEEYENSINTIKVIDYETFGKNTTSFIYTDNKNHNLRISNNVIGEILASYNDNGLKRQLTQVVNMSKNIKELSSYCFHGCNRLSKIDLLSTNITKIGESCFEGCSQINSLTLPNNLERLNNRIFAECENLHEITLNFQTFDKISQDSLQKSSIQTIYLPNMVSSDIYQYCSSMLIHFDSNNIGSTGQMTDIVLEYGEKWTCPSCGYTKEGYRFVGKWNTQPDGSGESYTPGTEYQFKNETITLYAQWKEKGKVLAILETCMNSSYGELQDGCKYGPKKMYNMISKCYDNVDEDVEVHILSDTERSKVGSYSVESPTKDNILALLEKGVSGEYDLVIMYISDHGSTNGNIGVKNGILSGKEVANVINNGDKETRIMLICDMCHAESFSPLKTTFKYNNTTYNSSFGKDFFDDIFETFDSSKQRIRFGQSSTANNDEPKLLGWYTCDSSHYGWMGYSTGMHFLARIQSLFSQKESYKQNFEKISALPYWYKMPDYYGYYEKQPKKGAVEAYHKKRNYHDNFDETKLIFT